jgi:hypothetical protein
MAVSHAHLAASLRPGIFMGISGVCIFLSNALAVRVLNPILGERWLLLIGIFCGSIEVCPMRSFACVIRLRLTSHSCHGAGPGACRWSCSGSPPRAVSRT